MYQANKDGCIILFDNKRTPAVALTCIPEIICRSSFNVAVPSISPSAKLAFLEMIGKLSTVIALVGGKKHPFSLFLSHKVFHMIENFVAKSPKILPKLLLLFVVALLEKSQRRSW